MSDNNFVTLLTLHHPLEAEALTALLRENGILARMFGTQSGSLIGVGQNILALRIEVAESDIDAARQIADQFMAGTGEEALRKEGVLNDRPVDAPTESPTSSPALPPRRSMAALWTLVLFGGSLLYSRLWLAAAFLLGGWLVALWALAERGVTGLAMVLLLWIADLIGGQLAFAHPPNRSTRAVFVQLLIGLTAVGGAALVAFGLADGLWGTHGATIGRRADWGLIFLCSPTLAFGLWLLPKWWRTRRRRRGQRENLVLGRMFAKEVWLFLNSASCIIAALVLLLVVGQQLVSGAAAAQRRAQREELSVGCSHSQIIITNNTNRTATLHIQAAAIREGPQSDYWKLSRNGERLFLPVSEHFLELSARDIVLPAGASRSIPYRRAATGPCLEVEMHTPSHCHNIALSLRGNIGAEQYDCELHLPPVQPRRDDFQLLFPFGLSPEDLELLPQIDL